MRSPRGEAAGEPQITTSGKGVPTGGARRQGRRLAKGLLQNMALDLLAILAEDRTWQSRANCMGVDPDLFFPERGASTKEAKEVCRGCVVKDDCLEFALRNGEKFGIWGGMSERERRRVRRARALAARQTSVG